jgi:hypothetical protein
VRLRSPGTLTRPRPQLAQVVTTHPAEEVPTRTRQPRLARGSTTRLKPTSGGRRSFDSLEANLGVRRGYDSLEANLDGRRSHSSPERIFDSPEHNHNSLERIFNSPEHTSGDFLVRPRLAQVWPYLAKLLYYILA